MIRRLGLPYLALAFTAVLLVFAGHSSVFAAADWDPLEGVNRLASWFRTLTANFDRVVETEKRGQLIRAVDKLRKELYLLEVDTRFLLESISDRQPTPPEHDRLEESARDLLNTVRRLTSRLREVGADLRLADRSEERAVEERLAYGLRTRFLVVTFVEERLQAVKSGSERWAPDALRAHLRRGLEAVRNAQLAATEFQAKLVRE